MKQEALKYFTNIDLTLVGLMIFVLFFVGLLFWVYRKPSQSLYEQMKNMPLQDGETHGSR